MKNVENGLIIKGSVYKLVQYTSCTECAFGNTDCSCINFCDLFEDLVLKDHKNSHMFKKIEENENK